MGITVLSIIVWGCMLGLMIRILVALSTIIAFSPCAESQGLKGAPTGCGRSASQPPPLIEGKSDGQRWAKFLSIQPSLIGMKFEKVERALGYGKTNAAKSELRYEITKSKYPSTPGTLANIDLSINFEHGEVRSYKVEAVFWGG